MSPGDQPLRLLLDTNVHSDWVGPKPCLPPETARQLAKVVSHPRVRIVLPFTMLLEFRWPLNKIDAWGALLPGAAPPLIAFGDPVEWELRCLLADGRRVQRPPYFAQSATLNALVAGVKQMISTKEFAVIHSALAGKAQGDALGLQTRRRPKGMSKSKHRKAQRQMSATLAEMMADPKQREKVLAHIQSPEFAKQLEAVVVAHGMSPDQVRVALESHRRIAAHSDAPDEDVRVVGIDPALLAPFRAVAELSHLPDLTTAEEQHRYVQLRIAIADASFDEAKSVYAQVTELPATAPAFSVRMFLRQQLEQQTSRTPHASDEADIRNISFLPHVDFVTTDAEMHTVFGSGPFPDLKSRLVKRSELGGLLADIRKSLT